MSMHTLPLCVQDTSLVDATSDHIIEERSANKHDDYEVIAQATCTSRAIALAQNGWIYAVRRLCRYKSQETCQQLCTAPALRSSDRQTSGLKWKSIGALHIYASTQSSAPSTVTNPSIGFKVQWRDNYDTVSRCGPNFCCCMALL